MSSNLKDVAVMAINREFLDASNTAEVKREIMTQLRDRSRVVVDLSRVNFMDSAGLSGLMSCLRQVAEAGGDMKLCGVTDEVRLLFDLIRLQRIFEMFDTTEVALLSFG